MRRVNSPLRYAQFTWWREYTLSNQRIYMMLIEFPFWKWKQSRTPKRVCDCKHTLPKILFSLALAARFADVRSEKLPVSVIIITPYTEATTRTMSPLPFQRHHTRFAYSRQRYVCESPFSGLYLIYMFSKKGSVCTNAQAFLYRSRLLFMRTVGYVGGQVRCV